MAITLGKDGSNPPYGGDIISATYTEEQEVIDITNRSNISGSTGEPGFRVYAAGFTTKTWEIECFSVTGVLESLQSNDPQSAETDFIVMGVTENIGVDGAVTYTVTAREA